MLRDPTYLCKYILKLGARSRSHAAVAADRDRDPRSPAISNLFDDLPAIRAQALRLIRENILRR